MDGRGDSVLLNYMDGPREGGGGMNGEVDFVLQYKFDSKLWHHIGGQCLVATHITFNKQNHLCYLLLEFVVKYKADIH